MGRGDGGQGREGEGGVGQGGNVILLFHMESCQTEGQQERKGRAEE